MTKAADLANASQGFISRGCDSKVCDFCVVPRKEGGHHVVSSLEEIIRPGSEMVTLLDNDFLAIPNILEILHQLGDWKVGKRKKLTVNISQGINVRRVTPEIAKALGRIKFWKQLRFAWDCPNHEKAVWRGIKTLSEHVRPGKQMVFMLCGFDSTFEQDMYRAQRIIDHGASPYCMPFNWNEQNCVRIKHFSRWLNGRIYKECSFEDYKPWIRDRHLFEEKTLFT